MKKCMYILFLAAFTFFVMHNTSEIHMTNDLFETQSSPQPYRCLSTPPPLDTQDIDATIPTMTLYIRVPQASISHEQHDLPSIYDLLDECSWLEKPAQVSIMTLQRDETYGASENLSTTAREACICKECKHDCRNKPNLRMHMHRKHGKRKTQGNIRCSICNKRFKSDVTLKEHRRKMHMSGKKGIAMYKCRDCTGVFTHKFWLHEHRKVMHPIPLPAEEYDCHLCSATCTSQNGLAKHMKAMHKTTELDNPSAKYSCHLCYTPCTSQGGLTRHISMIHKTDTMAPNHPRFTAYDNMEEKYRCELCPLIYASEKTLKRHVQRTHSTLCRSNSRASTNDPVPMEEVVE